MNVILVQTEFLCDLLIRQVQAEQVQADDPFSQRLMMMGEDRVGQIIKVFITGFAMVALPFLLTLMPPATANVLGLAPDTFDTLGPTHLPDTLVALCIVYQVIDLEHFQSMLFSISFSKN